MKLSLPLIIDNHFDGIGDAVCQCWVVNSARAAAPPHDVLLNIRAYPDIGYVLGMDEALTTKPGPRYFIDRGQGYHNWQHERAGMGRIRAWLKAYGLPDDIPLVRPPYIEHPHMARWASCTWEEAENAQGGKGSRILIFPECAWPNRMWPRPYFVDLAHALRQAGHTVIAMGTTEGEVKGFPTFMWGLKIPNLAAMMHRADLVIGNDSGPAHIAGTIGTPTLALFGPTQPEIVFGHMPEVRAVRVARASLPCVGCHFMGPYRPSACSHGCRALYMLMPEAVQTEVEKMLAEKTREDEVLTPHQEAPCHSGPP